MPSPLLEYQAFIGGIALGALLLALAWALGLFTKEDSAPEPDRRCIGCGEVDVPGCYDGQCCRG
jgi:hypothetical protein